MLLYTICNFYFSFIFKIGFFYKHIHIFFSLSHRSIANSDCLDKGSLWPPCLDNAAEALAKTP